MIYKYHNSMSLSLFVKDKIKNKISLQGNDASTLLPISVRKRLAFTFNSIIDDYSLLDSMLLTVHSREDKPAGQLVVLDCGARLEAECEAGPRLD